MEFSVIVPAYNEEAGIAGVIREIKTALDGKAHDYEIVVVDDGSSDATAAKAREAGAEVIEHAVNRGYGQSILTGMEAAKHDLIVTIDADSSYPAEAIDGLVAESRRFAMVVGQRTGKEYKGRLLKYPARIAFRWLAEYISGESIPDINSGLRVFRRSAYRQFPKAHECKGFSFSTTVTLLFMAAGYSARFVPIDYRHRSGASKINYYRDTLRALQILLEIGIHFNPLKIVLPMCALPLGLAFGFAAAGLAGAEGQWLSPALISLYAAMIIFGIGMLLLQIKVSRD